MTAGETGRIYLDHAATTPVRPEVRAAMAPYLGDRFGNPSSLHGEGRAAREALESARDAMRSALGARDCRVVFTGGGTESDNAAILGTLLARLAEGASPAELHVVASAVEHAAVLGALEVANRWGVSHTLVAVDGEGRVDPSDVLAALRPGTALVSVMAVNNETGTIEPIRQIGDRVRARGVTFHTDAIQLLGKGAVDIADLPADIVTLSAHKICGPKGVGALVVRDGVALEGLVRGGAQERGLRGGTESVAGAVGFAEATRLAVEELAVEAPRLDAMRRRLRDSILRSIDETRCNTPDDGAAPHILSVAFDGVEGESLLRRLDDLGVAVSTGSACNVGARKPSHVLAAMGFEPARIRGTLRFSLGRTTREEEVGEVTARVEDAVRRLRSIAPGRSPS